MKPRATPPAAESDPMYPVAIKFISSAPIAPVRKRTVRQISMRSSPKIRLFAEAQAQQKRYANGRAFSKKLKEGLIPQWPLNKQPYSPMEDGIAYHE